MTGYLAVAGGSATETGAPMAARAAFLPDPADFSALLCAFVVDKALYELRYELNSRPEMVGIPLKGILDLVGQDADPAGTGGG